LSLITPKLLAINVEIENNSKSVKFDFWCLRRLIWALRKCVVAKRILKTILSWDAGFGWPNEMIFFFYQICCLLYEFFIHMEIWNRDGRHENFDGLNVIWNMNVYSKCNSRLDNNFLITVYCEVGVCHGAFDAKLGICPSMSLNFDGLNEPSMSTLIHNFKYKWKWHLVL
jgi:hypothetical protein